MMEHSASVLDISSDDDMETKKRNEDLERGKENIPPPDFHFAQPRVQGANVTETGIEVAIEEPVKRPRLRTFVQDAMDEDRRPLGDLVPSEFYGEGCDASSYVTVDAGIEKPSSLSKEFDFNSPTPEKAKVEETEVVEAVPAAEKSVLLPTEEIIAVHVDEAVTAETVPAEEVALLVEAPAHQDEALVASS